MTKSPSPRPLSIQLIAALYLCLGIFLLGYLWKDSFADIALWLYMLFFLTLAVGLWQLRNLMRLVAIVLQVYLLATTAFKSFSLLWNLSQAGLEVLIIDLVILALQGTILWFLIKRKAAFVKPTTPSQG